MVRHPNRVKQKLLSKRKKNQIWVLVTITEYRQKLRFTVLLCEPTVYCMDNPEKNQIDDVIKVITNTQLSPLLLFVCTFSTISVLDGGAR